MLVQKDVADGCGAVQCGALSFRFGSEIGLCLPGGQAAALVLPVSPVSVSSVPLLFLVSTSSLRPTCGCDVIYIHIYVRCMVDMLGLTHRKGGPP